MNTTLALYANYSIYSAIAVLTLAMLAYAAYLARAIPAREVARTPERVLVGAGAPAVQVEVGSGAAAVDAGRKMAGIGRSFAWLATACIGVSMVLRGLAVHRPPLGNLYEFVCAASFAAMLGFCVWNQRRDVSWLGIFVVTPVLIMLLLAVKAFYTEASSLMPALRSYWLTIHVSMATISVGVFTLGAIVAALYLVLDRYARAGHTPRWVRVLPSPAELERTSYSLHIVAFPLWTFTVIAGAIWARQAWASYWNWDPKEVWSFIIWVVYAAFLHARATSGITRQKAQWIALAGFACIIVNYTIVNLYFVGQHSYSGM